MSNKKLFVHLHIYYFNQVDYFVKKLKNITGCDWDLCVTYCDDNEEMFKAISSLKPDVQFLKVKNIGYDIWPFIQAIRTVNLDDYDYILKLHTKAPKKMLFGLNSYKWRDNLVEFLLNSNKLFKHNIELLETEQSVGMICAPFSFHRIFGYLPEEGLMLNLMMTRLHLHYRCNYFCAGTMFLARASIYKIFAESDISETDFNINSKSGSSSTNAHVLERVFSLVVNSFGYNIHRVSKYYSLYLYFLNKKIFSCEHVRDFGLNQIRLVVYGKSKHINLTQPLIQFPSITGTKSIVSEFNKSEIKHKRLAIFAGFCSNGKISERQLVYLKGLKEVCDNIIFIADSDIFPEEVEKIKDLVCYCDCSRHCGYDFYSYKKGYEYARANGLLDDVNELVICNDSCYGPVQGFNNSFSKMNKIDCDFWGYTFNKQIRGHIQSYFYVFKQKVFMSPIFEKFISRIKKEKSVKNVILKYETVLTGYLHNAGFKYSVYIPVELDCCDGRLNKTLYPLTLLKYGCPLAKVKVFNNKFLGEIKEDSFDTVDYIASLNPELAAIIRKDNRM